MPSVACPACGKKFQLGSEEAMLYETVTCPMCDANLEVIDESPLTLEQMDD
jgi:lysine biosynthesis protein LysW